jgi:hypothetical protein
MLRNSVSLVALHVVNVHGHKAPRCTAHSRKGNFADISAGRQVLWRWCHLMTDRQPSENGEMSTLQNLVVQ